MKKQNYYKNLFYDIINDNYHGDSIVINNNKELLKKIFLKCSKSMINDKSFSFSFVRKCLDFVSNLNGEQRELVKNDFLTFFKFYYNDSFDIMLFLLNPNYDNCTYYISKILNNPYYYGSSSLNTNSDLLNNLNKVIMYYQSNEIDKYIRNLVIVLFIYCYRLNDYQYLYNYLEDPDYYYDKLINSGLLDKYKLNTLINYDFHYIKGTDSIFSIFNILMNNMHFIFPVQKKLIR